MDNKIFILILVIFLLTTPITTVSWRIVKYLIYLLLFISAIGMLSTTVSDKIKENLIKIINMDGSIILNLLSVIFSSIKNFFYPNIPSSSQPPVQTVQQQITKPTNAQAGQTIRRR